VLFRSAIALEKFLERHEHGSYLHQMEIEHIKRLIKYLRTAKSPHDGASHIDLLERDFKNFYEQYDIRRNKDFIKTFSALEYWYSGI